MIIDSKPARHAVILAAGLGSRLHPPADRAPGPLVRSHGIPILHNALCCLSQVGVRDVVIVVGYRMEAIIRSCGRRFAGVEITYCDSPQYEHTGSAYSLWLARSFLNRSLLLLDGDLFFDLNVANRLQRSCATDIAAVSDFPAGVTGSAVSLQSDGFIGALRTNQTAADARQQTMHRMLNVFKFSADTLCDSLVPSLDRLIRSGDGKLQVEELLKTLIDQNGLHLAALDCSDLNLLEIDRDSDPLTAEALVEGAAEFMRRRPGKRRNARRALQSKGAVS